MDDQGGQAFRNNKRKAQHVVDPVREVNEQKTSFLIQSIAGIPLHDKNRFDRYRYPRHYSPYGIYGVQSGITQRKTLLSDVLLLKMAVLINYSNRYKASKPRTYYPAASHAYFHLPSIATGAPTGQSKV